MSRAAALTASLVVAVLVGPLGASSQAADWREEPAGSLFDDVRIAAYDCGQQRVLVEAARGRAGAKRFGFLQTALIPTVELEDVTVEWIRDDGAREQTQLPTAAIDWVSKTVLTPAGTSLVRPQAPPRLSRSPHLLQDACQR